MKSYPLETIVSLCKRRGFVFPSAEIYGGLNGVYDFGPLGTLMKDNIRNFWKKYVISVVEKEDVYFIEGAILGPTALWEASGHVASFHDPLIDCTLCKHRYRADDIDTQKNCPFCGGKAWTAVRQFNMMFSTTIGATRELGNTGYLRPETAQAIFADFKNVMTSMRAKIPFGIAQIGKAFRNEITPKQFLFRMREFEQMEIEWFCKPEDAEHYFYWWLEQRQNFYKNIGIKNENISMRAHDQNELSHYSRMTTDVEYTFPFGTKELEGIAFRGDYDLSQHIKYSGKDLSLHDEATKTSYTPYVIECSVGVDRLFLALLCDAYHEETIEGEQRVVLRLNPEISPIKGAFLPLTKEHIEPMHELYLKFKKQGIAVQFDHSGSIGRRYRRQDEIGTPFCFTFDSESISTETVTIRYRDSMKQERINFDKIGKFFYEKSL